MSVCVYVCVCVCVSENVQCVCICLCVCENPTILHKALLAGNGPFWQQNITQNRKSFITQSKAFYF